MTSAFRTAQVGAVHAAYEAAFHAPPGAYAAGAVAVIARPGDAQFPYTAVASIGAGGSVLSVAPELLAVAESHLPADFAHIARAPFLSHFLRDDSPASMGGPELLWALGSVPALPALPPGLQLDERDAAWMNAEQPSLRFPNGVGRPGVNARESRNRFALVITGAAGEPVAVGGAFDSFGLLEIGVDVLPENQGSGLGRAVVAAAARAILDRGGTPLYGCAVDNIRSQRTALSVGFLPVLTEAWVS